MSHPIDDRLEEIEEYQVRRAYQAPSPPISPPANPKQAYGDRKPPLHLVPPALTLYAAQGLGEGAAKYGAYNWRSAKVEGLTYVGAALRHLAAYLDGEDVDPDSKVGKTHLAGAIASLAILADATEGGFLIDNRPPPGPAPRLILEGSAK